MTYDVEIRETRSQPIAAIRATVTAATIGATITGNLTKIYALLTRQAVAPSGPPVAVYYEVKPDRMVLEAGVPVSAAFESDEEIKPSALPSGRAAFTRHFGPYEGLGAAHDAVRRWIGANGHAFLGPSWEIYTMPPGGEPDPAKVVTEVYWRIQ